MDDQAALLTRLLADTDAIWLPARRPHGGRSWGNTYGARGRFTSHGVAWASGESTAVGRKAAQEGLEALAADGLIRAFKPRGGIKTFGVKLSAAAEAGARARCGLPGWSDAWGTMETIAELSERPAKTLTDSWIVEHSLIPDVPAGCTWGVMAATLEEMLLPVLVRGWVEGLADAEGRDGPNRVYYSLTAEGWAAIDRGDTLPPDPKGKADPEARALYYRRLEIALTHLAAADGEQRDSRDIGEIPLPVSMAGLPIRKSA